MKPGSDTPTVDQLRKAIDRGEAADKAPGVDPAAAPLGTDDEAGGNPPTREQRAMEAEAERRDEPQRPTAGGDATESLRQADADARVERREDAARPSEGAEARESGRAEQRAEGQERARDVIPSREDDAAGALSDDPAAPSGRPTAAP
jgi:hypothetical protein